MSEPMPQDLRQEHRRWDRLHRLRVAVLMAAMIFLTLLNDRPRFNPPSEPGAPAGSQSTASPHSESSVPVPAHGSPTAPPDPGAHT